MRERHTHLCMHFHCDPIFTCPQSVHIAESVNLASQYVSFFRDDPDFRCVLSEIDYLQGYWNTFVEDREEFSRLVKSGRIETSGSYSEPNENSVGGEALVRNIAYGQWYLVEYLGARGDVYMPFDVFGHVRQLPQLLRKAGFIGAVWTKGSPKGTRRNQEATWWAAPDGSRILNRVASYGGVDWGARDQLDGVLRMAARGHRRGPKDQPRADVAFRGSDFVSPPWWVVGKSAALQKKRVSISVPSAYFEDVASEVENEGLDLPLTGREMSLYHAGTALSRSELKIGARLAENAVLAAETWATVATLFGAQYPEAQIDHAWRQILFCQHHDSITGTSNDQSYLDLLSHLRESLAESVAARNTALAALASRIDTTKREGIPLVVFNSLSIPQTTLVEASLGETAPVGASADSGWAVVDEDGATSAAVRLDGPAGTRVRFRASEVPGVGHKTYWLVPADPPQPEVFESDDEPVVINTPYVRATFDPWRGGGIVSLIEKKTGREIKATGSAHPLNDLVLLKEGAGPEPSWEFNTTGDKWFSSTCRATVRAERSPTGWHVTVRHPFPETEGVVRTLAFSETSPRIDCTTVLVGYSGSRLIGGDRHGAPWGGKDDPSADEPEDRDLFGVLFPVGMRGVAPVWSDRFSARVIRKSQRWLDFRTHQSRFYSGCAMYSAEQWIAASPNMSVVLEGGDLTPVGFPFGMVRVVSPDRGELRRAAERLIVALAARGVTATPFFEAEDGNADPLQTDQIIAVGGSGRNAWVRSAIGSSKIPGARFVRDVALTFDDPTPMNPNRTVPALVIQGVGDEDGEVVAEVDRVISELADDRVSIPREAAESASLGPLDDAGLAILNRGTIAASCEPDGSLFMALQHSAGWCDWATPQYLGFPFVPERKTTVYHYAMLPFAGSWAEARLPEAALAYNRPPVAVAESRHAGAEPPRRRYISVEGDGVLVSAVKPAGNPSARHLSQTQDAAEGAIIRVWNWSRKDEPVRIAWWTGIWNAWRADLADRLGDAMPLDGATLRTVVAANAIDTLAITPLRAPRAMPPKGNAPAEPRRIHCRWWLHNAGAAPMGNLPVAIALHGDLVPGETGTVRVSVANNWPDRTLLGDVHLSGPEAWTIEPDVLRVRARPRKGMVSPVQVTVPAGKPGRLQAALVVEGITYCDTVDFGEVSEPEVRVSSRDDAISATVTNPSEDVVHLTLTLITPLEAWPEAGRFVRHPVNFRERALSLPPGGTERVSVPVPEGMLREGWAFLKLSGMGKCQYHAVPARLNATASVPAGAPFTLAVARADIALVLETSEEATLRFAATKRAAPPDDVAPSPVPDVTKYWTVYPVEGADAIRSARIRFGVIPAEIRSLAGGESARMAVWRDGAWKPLETTFDRRTWTLSVEVGSDILRAMTHWTIIGATCLAWRTRVGGRFFEAEPYVGDIDGDGTPEIVIGTARNQLCLLDHEGNVRWRRRFDGWIWPSAKFAVADVDGDGEQEIVAAPSDRTLWLLDRDGHVIWRKSDLPFSVKREPVVADIDGDGEREILVAIDDAGIWAFRHDGRKKWIASRAPMRLSRPAVARLGPGDEPTVLVSLGGVRLVFLTGTGKVARQIRFCRGAAAARLVAEPVATTALHGETEILFAGHDGILRLLTAEGLTRWQTNLGFPIEGTPLVVPAEGGLGPLVVCAARRMVYGITADGATIWKAELDTHVQSTPRLFDADGDGECEIVLGAARTGRTYVLRRDGSALGDIPYAAIWSSSAQPIIAGDGKTPLLVTGTTDEHVVAARLRKR